MRQPTDRVALTAPRRMLDEGVVAHAVAARGVHQRAHCLELMVAGEDHRLGPDLAALVVAFLLDLQVNETGEDVEQAVALQHLFPQVGGAAGTARRIRRVAGGPIAPLVEGQEMRRLSGQARGHTYHFGIHRKMHQRTTLEGEDRLARIAVLLVLAHRILYPLAGQRVLQFQRHDGDAVQAQRDVQRLLGARREVELAGQTQTVGGVAGFKLGIQLVRRLEIRGAQRFARNT